jgi:DNA-binding GntR family transcriptional regulator
MPTSPPLISDVVFDVVQQNVESGRLPAGATIRESDVARLLGVSRVPARTALKRLEEQGILSPAQGRGYLVPGERAETGGGPTVLDFDARHREIIEQRNWRRRIFDEAEMIVASAAIIGSFRTSEAAVSGHYGFGRNLARELLGRLERLGIARQLPNGRWSVDRVDDRQIRDHYAVRRALEPLALRESATNVAASACAAMIGRLEAALEAPGKVTRSTMILFEHDLHVDLVLLTPNRPMADAIRRSQLPLISTHLAFGGTHSVGNVSETLGDHLAVLQALERRSPARAATLLGDHLARAEIIALDRYSRLRRGPHPAIPPFLTAIRP